jgi:Lon protease-like protein
MFPLGTVLLPGVVLPLHVFEPRYRALVHDCMAGEPEFGVVLIERGREVGGGDARFDVGCVARIAQLGEMPDGRFALATVGTRRIRVDAWLPDDPYPRAEVTDWPDEPPGEGDGDRVEQVAATLRRVLAMANELGEPAAPASAVELADDPLSSSYRLAAMAPVGPLDRLALLSAPSVTARLAQLEEALAGVEAVLATRLAGG